MKFSSFHSREHLLSESTLHFFCYGSNNSEESRTIVIVQHSIQQVFGKG